MGAVLWSMYPDTSGPLDFPACLGDLYLCNAIAPSELLVRPCNVSLSTKGVFTVRDEVLCGSAGMQGPAST